LEYCESKFCFFFCFLKICSVCEKAWVGLASCNLCCVFEDVSDVVSLISVVWVFVVVDVPIACSSSIDRYLCA
jgi:ABC-type polysaccharide/polyol phosphate export permease